MALARAELAEMYRRRGRNYDFTALPASQADKVADCICEAACTGLAGDGVIVITPVERVMRIKQWRTRHTSKTTASRRQP